MVWQGQEAADALAASKEIDDLMKLDQRSLVQHCTRRKLNTLGGDELLRRRLEAWYQLSGEAKRALLGREMHRSLSEHTLKPSQIFDNLARCISDPTLRLLLILPLRLLTVCVFVWLMGWAFAGYGNQQLLMLEPEEYRIWRDGTRTQIFWAQVLFTLAPVLLRLCEMIGDVFDTPAEQHHESAFARKK